MSLNYKAFNYYLKRQTNLGDDIDYLLWRYYDLNFCSLCDKDVSDELIYKEIYYNKYDDCSRICSICFYEYQFPRYHFMLSLEESIKLHEIFGLNILPSSVQAVSLNPFSIRQQFRDYVRNIIKSKNAEKILFYL